MSSSSKTLSLLATITACSLLVGCPSSDNPFGGSDSGSRLVASYDWTVEIEEGLSAADAEALAEITEPIPQDLSSITYFGTPLFDEPGATAKTYQRSALSDCSNNIVRIRQMYRDMIATAAQLAERQKGVIRFPAGEDADLEPAQEGIAYVSSSKQYQRRAAPANDRTSVCIQHLHGLDCSGFTQLVFAGAGIKIAQGSWGQTHPTEWTADAIPAELGLKAVWIAAGAKPRYLTGDLMLFGRYDKTGKLIDAHVGIVIEAGGVWQVWNCAGSDGFSCEKNMSEDYGVVAWRGRDIIAGHKIPIIGVVRLVPACAAEGMTAATGDTVERLNAEWDALNQRWSDEMALYVQIYLDCWAAESPPGCLDEIGERAGTVACPLVRDMLCVVQRKALFLEYDETELYSSYAWLSGLLQYALADGSSCGCQ